MEPHFLFASMMPALAAETVGRAILVQVVHNVTTISCWAMALYAANAQIKLSCTSYCLSFLSFSCSILPTNYQTIEKKLWRDAMKKLYPRLLEKLWYQHCRSASVIPCVGHASVHDC
jgi:hypothetical protein